MLGLPKHSQSPFLGCVLDQRYACVHILLEPNWPWYMFIGLCHAPLLRRCFSIVGLSLRASEVVRPSQYNDARQGPYLYSGWVYRRCRLPYLYSGWVYRRSAISLARSQLARIHGLGSLPPSSRPMSPRSEGQVACSSCKLVVAR